MSPSSRSLSRDEIRRIAACPTCCARRGEQCTFARAEDPRLARTYAGQSHAARKRLAETIRSREENRIEGLARQLRL